MDKVSRNKCVISVWSALVFLLIASPFMFRITDMIFSRAGLPTAQIGSKGACPTLFGLLLHTVVFGLIVRGMMEVQLPGVEMV